jgi:hypothetical protein
VSGGNVMPNNWVQMLTPTGSLKGGLDIECEDDASALNYVRNVPETGTKAEIWLRDKRVAPKNGTEAS